MVILLDPQQFGTFELQSEERLREVSEILPHISEFLDYLSFICVLYLLDHSNLCRIPSIVTHLFTYVQRQSIEPMNTGTIECCAFGIIIQSDVTQCVGVGSTTSSPG